MHAYFLSSQHLIFTRHVDVGRDEPKSTALFIYHILHIHIPAFTHVTHLSLTRVVTSATVYHIMPSIMLYLFFRLRYPLLFKLLLVPLVTTSQSLYHSANFYRVDCPSLGRCVISNQDPDTRTDVWI